MADNLDYLYSIQSQYSPCMAELPGAIKDTYEINLSARKIESPEAISITSDHKAEVVYFVLDSSD